jgi:hypothetical protein
VIAERRRLRSPDGSPSHGSGAARARLAQLIEYAELLAELSARCASEPWPTPAGSPAWNDRSANQADTRRVDGSRGCRFGGLLPSPPRPLASSLHLQNAPGRNRTCDQWFRKPLLYPLSYEGKLFEPPRAERLAGSVQPVNRSRSRHASKVRHTGAARQDLGLHRRRGQPQSRRSVWLMMRNYPFHPGRVCWTRPRVHGRERLALRH